MQAVTEVWTVLDPSGAEIWSSGPNDQTSGAADLEASRVGGRVLRAEYVLCSIETEENYGPRSAVLEQRNQIREAVAEWEKAADGGSDDAEHEAARNMADILEGLLTDPAID